jgi:hypothetical protein
VQVPCATGVTRPAAEIVQVDGVVELNVTDPPADDVALSCWVVP